MQWRIVAIAVLSLATVPAVARAQDLQLSADGGFTRFLGEDQYGYGFNAYPGTSAGPITIEAQVGYHRGDDGHGALLTETVRGTTYIPIMAGGRVGLPLGVVVPWVGAHGGFSHVVRRTSSELGGRGFTNREWEPAFNAGLGVDLRINGFGVGAAFWYHGVADPDDPLRAVHAGVTLTIPL